MRWLRLEGRLRTSPVAARTHTNAQTPRRDANEQNRESRRIGLAPSVDAGYAQVPYGLYVGAVLCIAGLLGVLCSLWLVLRAQLVPEDDDAASSALASDLDAGYQLLDDDRQGGEGASSTTGRHTMAMLELFRATAGVGSAEDAGAEDAEHAVDPNIDVDRAHEHGASADNSASQDGLLSL